MVGSVEVSIIVWSIYITLKLFWKTFENGIIRGPLFHTLHKELFKYFVILRFWNKYSPFVPIFIMPDWKLFPIWGILYFCLMRNCTGNLAQFWKFVKMASDINYKIGITLDLDLTLTCGVFLKSYFWKVFQLTK